MRGRLLTAAIGGAAVTLIAGTASATITLNHGNASLLNNAPTTPTATAWGTHDFRPEGGATVDHLFANGWLWRVNGIDTREFAFSQVGMVEAGSGTPNGTRSWASLANGAFSAVLSLSLTDGGVAGAATVVQTLSITNTSGSNLDLSLFNYLDYDVQATTADTAAWFDQANNIMQINDATGSYGQYQGIGADAWQVTAFNTIGSSLTNTTITNLNNTGLPFSGDWTGAFQWNRILAAGASTSVTIIHTINEPVPAPGVLALLGLAGLVGARRRRK